MKWNIQWKDKRKRECQHQMKAFFSKQKYSEELNFIQGSAQQCCIVSAKQWLSAESFFQTWLHIGHTSGAMKAIDAWASLQEVLTHWSGGTSWTFHISSGGSNVQWYSWFHIGWEGSGKEGYYLLNSFKHHHKEKNFQQTQTLLGYIFDFSVIRPSLLSSSFFFKLFLGTRKLQSVAVMLPTF